MIKIQATLIFCLYSGSILLRIKGESRMMKVVGSIGALLIVAFFVSIPVFWIWAFYHAIKCRKVENCKNRKCRYWEWCEHNRIERKKDEIELRKKMLMRSMGILEDDLENEKKEGNS